MRIPGGSGRRRRTAAVMLVECLAYVALFLIMSALAFAALNAGWENHTTLRKSSDDLLAALRAGERWREDVRAAVLPPELMNEPRQLKITRRDGEVFYRQWERTIQRRAGTNRWETVLARVQSSVMAPEQRGAVHLWSWELELRSQRVRPRLRPLLRFQSVSAL